MNIDEVLLTDSEIEDEVAGDAWLDDMSWVCKAQCLKLLEWLKEEGLLNHTGFWTYGAQGSKPTWTCRDYCKLCELESKLKEA